MNSLAVAAIMIAVIIDSAYCAPTKETDPNIGDVDLETSASQHGWSALGYQGPLAGVPEVRGDGSLADTPEVVAARAAHLAALQAAIATNPDNDDGHYDPHKYGDDRYGVVSQVEDLTNSIAHYNTLASGHHSSGAVSGVAQEAAAKAQAQAQASVQAEAELALWTAKNAAVATASAIAQEAAANAQKQARAQVQAQASAKALWKAKISAAAAAIATGGYSYGAPAQQNKPYFGPLAMLQVLPSGYLADTQEVAVARNIHLSALAEAQAAEALWGAKYTQDQHRPWN